MQVDTDQRAVPSIGTQDSTALVRWPVIVRCPVLEQFDKGLEPVPFALIGVRATKLIAVSGIDAGFNLILTAVADAATMADRGIAFVGFDRQARRIDLTDPN